MVKGADSITAPLLLSLCWGLPWPQGAGLRPSMTAPPLPTPTSPSQQKPRFALLQALKPPLQALPPTTARGCRDVTSPAGCLRRQGAEPWISFPPPLRFDLLWSDPAGFCLLSHSLFQNGQTAGKGGALNLRAGFQV